MAFACMAGGTLYFFNLNNFNSRILYGMRPAGQISKLFAIIISIHAPLTGCDYCPPSCFLAHTDISIHAPLTGCDRIDPTDTLGRSNFNPRTPYGMRLLISSGLQTSICYFNPRTPYGMRPQFINLNSNWLEFQSTHPLRDATVNIHTQIRQ